MGKALFFDIDGTLVNFQGRMPDSARHALRKAQENGHKILICSGRSVCLVPSWLWNINFDGMIGGTGAYVECGGRIVYEYHMDRKALKAARRQLECAQACFWAQTRNGIIAATVDGKERMLERFSSIGITDEMDAVWRSAEIDGQLEYRCDIEKLLYYESVTPVAEIQEQLSEYCDVTASSFEKPTADSGEITGRGINKALGMQKYMEYINIAREDTIAFGDGPNDFDMLQFAGIGVAMGNAIDALKETADYVAAGVDQDGIAQAMQELGLI